MSIRVTENVLGRGTLLNELVSDSDAESRKTKPRKTRYLSRRLVELAAPRQAMENDGTYHYEWRTKWGNQEPIRAIQSAALNAISTDRIKQLAMPKLREQLKVLSTHTAVRGIDFERLHQLAIPRTRLIRRKYEDLAQRREAENAKRTTVNFIPMSPRLLELAKPFIKAQEVQILVNNRKVDQQRIEELAKPRKDHSPQMGDDQERKKVNTFVSEKVIALAKPKVPHVDHVPNRTYKEIHEVRKSSLTALCSGRTSELAAPRLRESSDHIEFRDDAWIVSAAAKKAHASSRTIQLATPKNRE